MESGTPWNSGTTAFFPLAMAAKSATKKKKEGSPNKMSEAEELAALLCPLAIMAAKSP